MRRRCGHFRLPDQSPRDAEQSTVGTLDGLLRCVALPTKRLRDLAEPVRDAPSHTGPAKRELCPCLLQLFDLSRDDAGHVIAETAVAREVNRCLDDRGVGAHAVPSRDPGVDGERDDSVEQWPENLFVEQLAVPHHRLRVRHNAGVDPAEAPIDEVAVHFPLELLVAPLKEMLEHEHAKDDFRRRARPAARRALGMPTPQRRDHAVDDRVVIKELIDPLQPRVHELLWRRQRPAEEHRICERSLTLSAASRHSQ